MQGSPSCAPPARQKTDAVHCHLFLIKSLRCKYPPCTVNKGHAPGLEYCHRSNPCGSQVLDTVVELWNTQQ